jgi:uncharacterized protein (TIGR03437 family)
VNAIRRFPAGSCFTVRAPQISVDEPAGPITAQPLPASPTALISVSGAPFFAPGELITIYGSGLGPQAGVSAQANNGFIPTELSGVRVLFEGVPAPVLYASDSSLNVVIPFGVYGYYPVLVQVENNGVLSDAIALEVIDSAPIVFTGAENAAIVANQDGSLNSGSNPAAPGSIITFYGSGFGLTNPAGADGHLASAPLPQPVLPVSATANGQPATVLFAGDASGMVEGIVQVNLRLPMQAPAGLTNVFVTVVVGDNNMQFYLAVNGTKTSSVH